MAGHARSRRPPSCLQHAHIHRTTVWGSGSTVQSSPGAPTERGQAPQPQPEAPSSVRSQPTHANHADQPGHAPRRSPGTPGKSSFQQSGWCALPMMLPTPLTDRYCASMVGMVKWQYLALCAGAAGQIAPEHGLEADRGLLLGQQRALGHAEHEFRSHLLRGTHQLRSTATEQAILRKVSENRAPIAPLHHPNEGWELRLHQRQRGVFTPRPAACMPHRGRRARARAARPPSASAA